MKPYFSISIGVMPWSTDIDGDTDQIRLTLAQYTESESEDGINGQLETIERVSCRIGEALEWLAGRFQDTAYFWECVAGAVLEDGWLSLESYLEKEADCGDADFGDMIRRIAAKCEAANI